MSPSFRQTAVLKANELWATFPVFLDTETTGLHNRAEIIEVCVLEHDGGVLFESLVRPHRSIPPDAVQIHNITDELVRESPTWLQVWPQLEAVLKNRVVGIYNAEFDLRMLQQTHQVYGLPWRIPMSRVFCIMKLYSDFSGFLKWQSLEAAGRQSRIPLPNSHRARDDTLLARELFLYIKSGGGK
jgi:DNA polymerase-3 subunit epsilon